ncbi:MAG: leucine-rich repeat protein, partial [Clostridia bacterium]|nr:leucine-rich repeat protein [Clostridia bacterium]
MNVKKKVILIVLMSIMFYLLIFMSNNKVYADSEDIVISKNYDISQAVNKSCNVIVNEIYEATVVNESTVATSLKEISLNIYGTGKMRDNPFSGFKNESISLGSRGGSTNLMSFNNVTVQIQFGVVNIGAGAFEGFQIKSLSIYDSVTSIGSNAFLNCINLKELSMSNN